MPINKYKESDMYPVYTEIPAGARGTPMRRKGMATVLSSRQVRRALAKSKRAKEKGNA